MDNFHVYIKKQLLEYVEAEREKGIPLEVIEKTLRDAGHKKNIIDEVFLELEKEKAGGKKEKHKDPVENDLVGQLKNAFSQFMSQANKKEVDDAKKDLKKSDTDKIVEEVIEEAEVIEEKIVLESITFVVFLLGLGFIMLITAAATDSSVVNVALGFSPVIISAFICLLIVKFIDNVPLFMFIPLLVSGGFYALGRFGSLGVLNSLDMEALAIVNFLFAFAFSVILVYVRFMKPKHMKKRVLKRPGRRTLERKKEPEPEKSESKETHSQRQKPKSRKEIEDLKKEFNL